MPGAAKVVAGDMPCVEGSGGAWKIQQAAGGDMYGRNLGSAVFYGRHLGAEGRSFAVRHTVYGDNNDRTKYIHRDHPLAEEDGESQMKDHARRAARLADKDLEKEYNYARFGNWVDDNNNTLDPRLRNHNWSRATQKDDVRAVGLGVEMARDMRKERERKRHQNFVHGFVEWLRGNGTPDEYERAGMPGLAARARQENESRADAPANKQQTTLGPISDDPEVIEYLKSMYERVIDYQTDVQMRKLRQGRTGPPGKPSSLDDLWKLYKYGVHGMEDDKNNDGTVSHEPPVWRPPDEWRREVGQMRGISRKGAAQPNNSESTEEHLARQAANPQTPVDRRSPWALEDELGNISGLVQEREEPPSALEPSPPPPPPPPQSARQKRIETVTPMQRGGTPDVSVASTPSPPAGGRLHKVLPPPDLSPIVAPATPTTPAPSIPVTGASPVSSPPAGDKSTASSSSGSSIDPDNTTVFMDALDAAPTPEARDALAQQFFEDSQRQLARTWGTTTNEISAAKAELQRVREVRKDLATLDKDRRSANLGMLAPELSQDEVAALAGTNEEQEVIDAQGAIWEAKQKLAIAKAKFAYKEKLARRDTQMKVAKLLHNISDRAVQNINPAASILDKDAARKRLARATDAALEAARRRDAIVAKAKAKAKTMGAVQ